jgi:DNA-binding HxlR family transcriptional regulator
MIRYRSKDFNCPIEFTVDLIGGRWKTRIIWFLGKATRRFGELERLMPDTSRKVLIQQLKELETDGIVVRTVYAQVPPKVEYSLTEQGQALIAILQSMRLWGERQIEILGSKQEENSIFL